MKTNEIKIGRLYVVKLDGGEAAVRVEKVEKAGYRVTRIATGRSLTLRSAGSFLRPYAFGDVLATSAPTPKAPATKSVSLVAPTAPAAPVSSNSADVLCPQCGTENIIDEDDNTYTCCDCGAEVDLRDHRRSP